MRVLFLSRRLAVLASAALAVQAMAQLVRAPAAVPQEWRADAGSTLHAELNKWAERASWTVVFDSKVDYPLLAELRFEGRFDEAVAQFIRLYEKSDQPLVVDISMSQRLVYVAQRRPR